MNVTIIMYHYVRNPDSRVHINSLGIDDFVTQVDRLCETFELIDFLTLSELQDSNRSIDTEYCVLTFDDGFIDHYKNVLPILVEKKLPAVFYPNTYPIISGHALIVHKIQYLIALGIPIKQLKAQASKCFENLTETKFPGWTNYRDDPSRFDSSEEINFKRKLQRDLPRAISRTIIDTLFANLAGLNEEEFVLKTYMNGAQERTLLENGFEVGLHTRNHEWLGLLPGKIQEDELVNSLSDLTSIIGPQLNPTSIAYPYGSYNDETLQLCKLNGISFGCTTKPGKNEGDLTNQRYELRRFDTNDFRNL